MRNELDTNIIKEWPLSLRTKNALLNEDIIYLGDLISLHEKDLMKFRNFGIKSVNEIKTLLVKLNYSLNTKIDNWTRPEIEKKNKNSFFVLKKNLFKNHEEVKKIIFEEEKIFINENMRNDEVEDLLINDIKLIINLFTDQIQKIFQHRFAYESKFMTLEELGNEFKITRERVRQKESSLYKNIKFLGKIHKLSLVKFLLKKEDIGFHKIFPRLAKKFNNTSQKSGKFFNTHGDSLIFFLETFCDVENAFFKTPETILMNFDKEKIKNIFIESRFPLPKEFFLEEIKKNYGYTDLVANDAFDYMKDKNIIIEKNYKIFPSKISKILEVSNILLEYPNGLGWKEISKIGNDSPTDNQWNLNRKMGDHSITMESNPYIFLSKRGNYKHNNYCNFIDKKDDIIKFFIDEIKKTEKKEAIFDLIFNKITKDIHYKELDFFEARAIIKIYGEEKGLYHKGASSKNILSISKNFSKINTTLEIFNVINTHPTEISIDYLKKIFHIKTLSIKLNILVDDLKIFKISPGIFLNYNDGINLCDINEIEKHLKQIIKNYEFLTSEFIREYLNKDTGYKLSSLYYQSICKILAIKNNWYIGHNYLSYAKEKVSSLDTFIKNNYQSNKDTRENFDTISRQIGISRKTFDSIIYNNQLKFDSSWMKN